MLEKKTRLMIAAASVAVAIALISSYSNLLYLADTDSDGIPDFSDNCPSVPNPDQSNYDGDARGNFCDQDDDNDKVVDAVDAFDIDSSEWADFDFDGKGSVIDKDDDNDGILDNKDPEPILISEKLTQHYLTEIESCVSEEGPSRLLCYGNFFDDLVEQEVNDENALKLALALSKIGALDDCHFVSHIIGHASFDETLNIYQNFEVVGSLCRAGYIHGVMGAFFHNLKDNNEPVPDNYKIICNDFIGSSNYQKCLHGIGHGLVNYNPTNLETVLDYCYEMSYYQSYACTSGAMMQYTDNRLTEFGATKENLSNMCSKSELNEFEFQMCSQNIGVSLAFHNNHEMDKSSKFCEMIENEKGREFCLEQLKEEILKYEQDKLNQFTEKVTEKETEKFQPQWIKQEDKKWIVDFRSVAIISDFEYIEETKEIQFSFDVPEVIGIYAWNELLPEKLVVTINGIHEENVKIQYDAVEPITAIRISPTTSGTILISGFE